MTDHFTFDPDAEAFIGFVGLRAERDGHGDGRAYTIVAVVKDAEGNATQASTAVVVPDDRGRGGGGR